MTVQWTVVNGITLVLTVTGPNNQIKTINKYISYTKYLLRGQFDPNN
jgi:hypothetical protein